MGYNHYWRRPRAIERDAFAAIAEDFRKCVLPLDDLGVLLAGPDGDGLPMIEHEEIAFNGIRDCNHLHNAEIRIPFPSAEASGIGSSHDAVAGGWFDGVRIRCRTCNGDCSYEPFVLERVSSLSRRASMPGKHLRDYCKTAFRPYDLAVQCALIIARHHLGHQFAVWSSGSELHWNDARRFCYVHLGYRLEEFRLDADSDNPES